MALSTNRWIDPQMLKGLITPGDFTTRPDTDLATLLATLKLVLTS
jgi:hypothetical protein